MPGGLAFRDEKFPDNTAKKIKFFIKDFVSQCYRIRFLANLVTLTEEILNERLRFLCSVSK